MVRNHYRPPRSILLSASVALVVAGCGVDLVSASGDDHDRSRAEIAASAPADDEPDVEADAALRRTLDEVAQAMAGADPDALRPWLHDGSSGFATAWMERAANLASVPVRTYELELEPTSPELTTSLVHARFGEDARVVHVVERYTLEGIDGDGPAVEDLYLTVVPDEGGRWRIASDRGAEPLGLVSARHLWDIGPVEVERADPFLIIYRPGRAGDVPALLTELRAAFGEVQDRWPLPWSEQVAVLVPESEEELATLLNVTFDLSNFIAFATANADGELGDYELTGSRIVVNPARFLNRTSETRRRILAHELVHVASRPHAGPFMPAWVEEGVAQVIGEEGSTTGTALLDAAVGRGAGAAIPLDTEFTTSDRSGIFLSYQRAWSFVDHLVETHGVPSVGEFYAALGRGAVGEPGTRSYHVQRATRQAFGSSLEELRDAWIASLGGS